MNNEQIKLLSKMKKLIISNRRRFILRKNRDYVKELIELGITEEEAWNYILSLNANYYVVDYKPGYNASSNSLTFKRKIKNEIAYIKLKIEVYEKEEETVCLSFHIDHS